MRLMFVYFVINDAGSAQDIANYSRVAQALGHDVAVYGPPQPGSSFNYSMDIESADAVIFIFEWTTELRDGDYLDWVRLVGKVPRERRVVIDCDGAYNEAMKVNGDYNHRDSASSQLWIDICASLSDKICQPTLHPLRPNVRTFFFHAYDPAWERPLDFANKEFGMIYVGHSKFRWRPMHRVLHAIEPSQEKVGRIAVIGHGWDSLPPWAVPMQMEDAYYTEPEYMKRLGLEVMQPILAEEVIDWMSKAVFNPVIYRPLFERLCFVTCRTFETFGASTIPLFGLEPSYVTEIYGEQAVELVLPSEDGEEKIADIVRRPEYYARIVGGIRQHLRKQHSYKKRFEELLDIVLS